MLHLRTNQIVGVEALVRWNHPQQGRVLPGEFIDLAEQTGLINPLTTIVLETAIREWAPRQKTPPLSVAVNLSPRTLQDPRLAQRIEAMLSAYDARSTSLSLEITENILMSDPTRSMDCLKRLHDMGVRLVIDDFGTGYSSLSYLRRFRFDKLKIDKSFVHELGSGGSGRAIVRAVIELGRGLGMETCAEGVETEEQRGLLAADGCGVAQGFLFGRPRPIGEPARAA
jgi:diguanylate cyclase